MDVAPIIDQIITAMTYIGLMIGVGLMFFVVIVVSKFKHKVNVKFKTSTGNRIVSVKAREYQEDGVEYWKLQNHKGTKFKLMPKPPAKYLNFDDKGKLIVEAYYLETEEWSFCETKWGEQSEDTFTPAQKNQLIRQIKKIEARKKNGIHDLVAQAMPYLFLLVLMVLGVAFYEELISPAQEMGDKFESISANLAETAESQEQIMKYLKEVIKQEQVIQGDDILINASSLNG